MAFLQVVPSSAIHGPMRVPSTSSVRWDGISAMVILNMCTCGELFVANVENARRLPKRNGCRPWQSVESKRRESSREHGCRRLTRPVDNCREWRQTSPLEEIFLPELRSRLDVGITDGERVG